MEGQLQYLASLWLQQQAEKENTSVAELNERLQKATLEEKPEGHDHTILIQCSMD